MKFLSGLVKIGFLATLLQMKASYGATISMFTMSDLSAYNYSGFNSSYQNTYLSQNVFLPIGNPYKLMTATGHGTVYDGQGSGIGIGSSINYDSFSELSARESGLWTLITNLGMLSETLYSFNVNIAPINPQPFVLDVYHLTGTPENRVHIDIDGPVDAGPFEIWISSSGPGGSQSIHIPLSTGTRSYDADLVSDLSDVQITVVRSTSVPFFDASIPTTADGLQIADWSLGYSVTNEVGGFFGSILPERVPPVSDSNASLVLFSMGLAAVGWLRGREKNELTVKSRGSVALH